MKIYIPIKHSSQRLPNKNFLNFNGVPLWENLINKLTDFETIVDTDSEKIIEECKNKPWVKTYFRPMELRGHGVSVVDLIKNYFDKHPTDEWIAQIHVTSPFLSVEHLKGLERDSKNWEYDSAFSVDVIQNRLWREESYGICPINHNPCRLEQTQNLPEYYAENSYFYLFTTEVLKLGNRIGKNPKMIPMGFPFNLDIDTKENWEHVISIKQK